MGQRSRPVSAENRAILRGLQVIPGVGPSIAQDLFDLGIRSPGDLAGGDPETLYQRLCRMRGCRLDRCMLYVLRCAVYYASEAVPDPSLLKWWSWKKPRGRG
jgi:hypothetical protein